MLLHRIFLRLRYAVSGLPLAGVALLLAGEWRWGAGALAGGAVLYPLFDVLERRCRPPRPLRDRRAGPCQTEIQMTGDKSYLE